MPHVFADEVVQQLVSRRVRKLRADEAVRLLRSVNLPVQDQEQVCVRQPLLLELDGVGVAAYPSQCSALPDVREEGLEAEVEGAGDDVRAIVHAAGSHERAPNLRPARFAGEGHEEVRLAEDLHHGEGVEVAFAEVSGRPRVRRREDDLSSEGLGGLLRASAVAVEFAYVVHETLELHRPQFHLPLLEELHPKEVDAAVDVHEVLLEEFPGVVQETAVDVGPDRVEVRGLDGLVLRSPLCGHLQLGVPPAGPPGKSSG